MIKHSRPSPRQGGFLQWQREFHFCSLFFCQRPARQLYVADSVCFLSGFEQHKVVELKLKLWGQLEPGSVFCATQQGNMRVIGTLIASQPEPLCHGLKLQHQLIELLGLLLCAEP